MVCAIAVRVFLIDPSLSFRKEKGSGTFFKTKHPLLYLYASKDLIARKINRK